MQVRRNSTVASPSEAIECAQVLGTNMRSHGVRVAVMADGGGHGGVAADLLIAAGLQVPVFSMNLSAELAGCLPLSSGLRNPVDLVGAEQDFSLYSRVAQSLIASGEVDAVLLTGYFGGYSERSEAFQRLEIHAAEAFCRVARDANVAVAVHTMNWAAPAADILRRRGIPVYGKDRGRRTSTRCLRQNEYYWRVRHAREVQSEPSIHRNRKGLIGRRAQHP